MHAMYFGHIHLQFYLLPSRLMPTPYPSHCTPPFLTGKSSLFYPHTHSRIVNLGGGGGKHLKRAWLPPSSPEAISWQEGSGAQEPLTTSWWNVNCLDLVQILCHSCSEVTVQLSCHVQCFALGLHHLSPPSPALFPELCVDSGSDMAIGGATLGSLLLN